MSEEFEIVLDERKLKEHIYRELTELGYAVSEDEADDIAAIAFDYVLELGLIEEEE